MEETYFKLLQGLAEYLELPPEDITTTQELLIDDLTVGLTCLGDETASEVAFFIPLGVPAPERTIEVHRTLLEANSLWVGTGGATLALQPGSDQVLICAQMPLEGTTPEALAQVLDTFVDAAQFWKTYVEGAPGQVGAASQDRTGPDPLFNAT